MAEKRKYVTSNTSANERGISRRRILQGGTGVLAAAAVPFISVETVAQQPNQNAQTLRQLERGGRILIKGGTVITMDSAIGDFAKGDLLIEDKKILKVAPNVIGPADVIVDASGMIVIPGLVDVHRHCWEGVLRRLVPDGNIDQYRKIRDSLAVQYKPEDMYAGNLISALGCIDVGVTCVLDWSHNSRSAAHSNAAIQALLDSEIRAVYGFGAPTAGSWDHQHPQDLVRLKKRYFPSDDQLVSIYMATFIDFPENIKFARDHGVRITVDGSHGRAQGAAIEKLGKAGLLGADITYNHCTDIGDGAWQVIADTGGTVGLAPASDVQIGVTAAVPPVQKALDFGILPALGTDVETNLPTDFFTQMRVALYFQRSGAFHRKYEGDANAPAPISMRNVLEFATVQGAKANGVIHKCGTLSPGKEADIVMIRAEDINTMPLNNAIGTVVGAADSSNVDTVFIGGKVKKFKGKLVGVDLTKVSRLVHDSRDRLLQRSGIKLAAI